MHILLSDLAGVPANVTQAKLMLPCSQQREYCYLGASLSSCFPKCLPLFPVMGHGKPAAANEV